MTLRICVQIRPLSWLYDYLDALVCDDELPPLLRHGPICHVTARVLRIRIFDARAARAHNIFLLRPQQHLLPEQPADVLILDQRPPMHFFTSPHFFDVRGFHALLEADIVVVQPGLLLLFELVQPLQGAYLSLYLICSSSHSRRVSILP